MSSRAVPVLVGLFAAIGAWVVGQALGRWVASSDARKPEEPEGKSEAPRDIEDAVEVSPKE